MAKGITEAQVHAAADALVGAGERPTVERIRGFLGTGSPNTVTRMLDGWWQTLGARLSAQQAKLALPDAPDEVVGLVSQLWEQALRVAREQLDAATAVERQALADAQDAIATERATHREDMAQHRQAVEAARQRADLAETRLADAQRLAEQQSTQLADLVHQRAALLDRNERLEGEFTALAARLHDREAAALAERDALNQHLRTVEDRAHADVDAARQELKQFRSQLATLQREHATGRQRWQHEQQALRAAVAEAQQDAAAQRARGDALDGQLAQLGPLSATLHAALSHAAASKPRMPRKAAMAARRPKPPRRR